MVHLAIVGVGGYGWGLIRELLDGGEGLDCRLVAAADADLAAVPEHADELRRRGVALYGDAVEMFQAVRGRCEAAYIASSIPSHAPLTVAAARCGLHVHLEKPPAATVQEVDEMLGALDAAGRMCLVGFQALHGDMRLILDATAAGRLGRVESITCAAGWPRMREYYRRNDWAGRLRRGERWVLDGPVTNALAHQVAHMLAMASGRAHQLATPTAVRAELYAAGPVEGHNVAALEVQTAEGPLVRFFASHATAGSFGPVIELSAERGRAVYAQRQGSRLTLDDGSDETRPFEPGETREMIANFLDAVRASDPSRLRCPLAETRKFVLALDGAHESSGRVHRIGREHWHFEEADTDRQRVVVGELDGILKAAKEQGRLFSDLPDAPPWAVAADPFDLDGYVEFPQRFVCE